MKIKFLIIRKGYMGKKERKKEQKIKQIIKQIEELSEQEKKEFVEKCLNPELNENNVDNDLPFEILNNN